VAKQFRKVVVPPGEFETPEGKVTIGPDRIKGWVETFGRMKAAGLRVPVPWGHQSQALPAPDDAEFFKSKYNATYVDSLEQAADGSLVMVAAPPPGYDVSDAGDLVNPADGTTIGEVSLDARPWKDGRGAEYGDAVVHVALVTHPVASGTPAFEPVPGEVRLSLSRLRMAYDNSGVVPLADKPVLNPDHDPGKKPDGGLLARIADRLKKFGVNLPDEAKADTAKFLEYLDVGLAVIEGREVPVDKPEEQVPKVPEGATPERSTAVRMSLADARTPTEQIMFARAERECRQAREALIDQLACARDGQGVPLYSGDEVKSWRDQAAAVQFSLLTATGDPEETPLDRELAVAKRMADRFAPAKLSLASPLPHPLDRAGDQKKKHEEAGDFLLSTTGRVAG
jgi:hypothetical protein